VVLLIHCNKLSKLINRFDSKTRNIHEINKSIRAALMLILVLTACSDSPSKAQLDVPAHEKIITSYNLKFKHSDSLAQPEILLELIIENRSDFGVMIKYPFIKAEDIESRDEYTMENLFEGSDYAKIPTYMAYEESLGNPIKNPLRFKLQGYVLDSLEKRGERFDNLNSDVYGFTFIKPSSKSVCLTDLTLLLNKLNGQFKIYAYHKNDFYNYNKNHVPEFQGYRKIGADIHFDTFYLASERKK
jgi:hypothetical protein